MRSDNTSSCLTYHANARMRQRAVSQDDVSAVMQYGRTFRQPGGRLVWYVGSRDMKLAARAGVDLSGAHNVAVILAADGAVVTVVRSADLRRLRRPSFGSRP